MPPSSKDIRVLERVEESAEEPLKVPPQLRCGVGGRTPIWGRVGLEKQ